MKQVRRTSLSEQVLESILDYIQENHLSIGDKLPTEEELTERLNVSRTSVREALKGLSINGVVESIAGKGDEESAGTCLRSDRRAGRSALHQTQFGRGGKCFCGS